MDSPETLIRKSPPTTSRYSLNNFVLDYLRLPTTSCDHKTGNLILPVFSFLFNYLAHKALVDRSVVYLVYAATASNVFLDTHFLEADYSLFYFDLF